MSKEQMMRMFDLSEDEYDKIKYKYDNIVEPVFMEMFNQLGIIDKDVKVDKETEKLIRKEFDEVFNSEKKGN